jgi:hypothetical protein
MSTPLFSWQEYWWLECQVNLRLEIAQTISRWLPTAAAQVWAQVRSCGICGGQSGTGAGFLLVLRFLLPILIPLTASHSSPPPPPPPPIIQGWYNRPISGRRIKWTQFHPTPKGGGEERQKRTWHFILNVLVWSCKLRDDQQLVNTMAIDQWQNCILTGGHRYTDLCTVIAIYNKWRGILLNF